MMLQESRPMDEIIIRSRNPRPPLVQARDWLAVGVRHRRLLTLSFMGVLTGTVLAIFLLPPRYQSNTKILVKRERVDLLVTADPTGAQQQPPPPVTETDLNSEVELIKSQDLMESVAKACGLEDEAKRSSWFSWLHLQHTADEESSRALDDAVRNLKSALKVESLSKTSLISITYSDHSPTRAAQVLSTLVSLYMEKHLAVHRPTGTLGFFQDQTKQFEEGLKTAESKLLEFSKEENVVSPGLQKTATLQKLSEFQGDLKQAQGAMSETQQRIRSLESQAATLPTRMTTQLRTADNPQLMEQLKTTLLNLELKRTELLQKFEPSYRLVQEVDTQIQQTKSAIETAESSKPSEETTDRNPVYEWVDSELAKARAQLAAETARAVALSRNVLSYEAQANDLDKKGVIEESLVRDKNTEEANYLLYQRKQEEARISDALDRSRIINVAVAEAAAVPVMPSRSSGFILLAGLLAGIVVSVGAAAMAEFLNPSLVTSDDVQHYLDVPVLASITTRIHEGD
jgi:uncharacterized protein involved in exopolysaccharide biosynthesis